MVQSSTRSSSDPAQTSARHPAGYSKDAPCFKTLLCSAICSTVATLRAIFKACCS